MSRWPQSLGELMVGAKPGMFPKCCERDRCTIIVTQNDWDAFVEVRHTDGQTLESQDTTFPHSEIYKQGSRVFIDWLEGLHGLPESPDLPYTLVLSPDEYHVVQEETRLARRG